MAGFSSLRNIALAVLPFTATVSAFKGSRHEQRSAHRHRAYAGGDAITKRASWTAAHTFKGSNFFDNFSFFKAGDPTHGLVDFVSDGDLAYVDSNGNAIMKVDNTTNVDVGGNRRSVRIGSNVAVNENSLVIMSANHYPYGCAVWPAFWMVGPNWPNGGEIDIFEGVNLNSNNQMTLHTAPGCTQQNPSQTGTTYGSNCDAAATGNAGCGVGDPSTASYGDELNNAHGGTFATLWDSNGISIFFWNTGSVPSDVTSGSPDPTSWGTPHANWPSSGCAGSFFNNLQIVFDITLCGDWAGAAYGQTCGSSTCPAQVAQASNFDDAYFSVESVVVYTS